jgi:signal transduction histidine kinase
VGIVLQQCGVQADLTVAELIEMYSRYCAACIALVSPSPAGFAGVLLCAALAAGGSSISGASGGIALGFASSAAGVGLLMLLLRDLRMRNEELTEARAERARLAVAEERERFARDLHDLLGRGWRRRKAGCEPVFEDKPECGWRDSNPQGLAPTRT